jgi:hypothetical protein
VEIPPLPFRSLTLSLSPFFLATVLPSLRSWGVPNSTTNQQYYSLGLGFKHYFHPIGKQDLSLTLGTWAKLAWNLL